MRFIPYILTLVLFLSCKTRDNSQTELDSISGNKFDTLSDKIIIKTKPSFDTVYIKPIINYTDKGIKNNTDYKVDLLYDQNKNNDTTLNFWVFGLFKNRECHLYDGSHFFSSDSVNIVLTKDGIILSNEEKIATQILETPIHFDTNDETYNAKSEGRDYTLYYIKQRYHRDYGEIFITNGLARCGDTGHNPVKIVKDGKSLTFTDIRNILLFDYDIDEDGKKEVYLFDYACCKNEIRIFKIYE